MTRETALRIALALMVLCALPFTGTAAEVEEEVISRIEISSASPFIVLPVTIAYAGQSHLFALDPLSECTVFDLGLKTFAGPRIANQKTGVYYKAPEFRIEGCILDTSIIGCQDLQETRELIGEKVAGTLGARDIKLMSYRVDIARGKFEILNPAFPLKRAIGVPPKWHDRIAINAVLGINGAARDLHGDFTSRSIVTLDSELFDSLVDQGHITLYDKSSVDIFHDGVLSRLTIRGQVYDHVPVRKGRRNTFGLLLFQNDTLSVNLVYSHLAVDRDTAPRKREWVPWHGLAVYKPNGRITINRIAPRGPAAKAGLAVGDVIESINEGPVRFLPVSDVEFHDAWDTGRVEIEYLRNGEKHKATVIKNGRPDKE